MMERVGQITAVEDHFIEVTFCHHKDCDNCHACEGGQTNSVIRLPGTGTVGDLAVVELPTATVVKASFLAYVLPLAGFFGGMLLGNFIDPIGSGGTAIGGLIGLILSGSIVFFTEQGRKRSRKWQPILIRTMPPVSTTSLD